MKVFFQNTAKSYGFVIVFGVLAGLAVVLFMELPDNRLWSFYDWSASTFGFWMFSTSLIVLCSETRRCAALHAGIYIFLMFLITTAHQSFQMYQKGVTPFHSLFALAVNHIGGWLLYSVPPAAVCALLGLVLWSGRKDSLWGKILRLLPAVCILLETAILFYWVVVYRTRLFSALSDIACLLSYLIIIKKARKQPTTD